MQRHTEHDLDALTWHPLDATLGALLWGTLLSKAQPQGDGSEVRLWKAGRYIKRWMGPNGRWRYAYNNAAGHIGAGHFGTQHMVVGSKFKHGNGHYEVHEDHGDEVTVSHEGGAKERLSKDELQKRLLAHHAPAIAAHRESLAAQHKEAIANGNTKGAEKIASEAAKHGYTPKPTDTAKPTTPARDPHSEHIAKTYRATPEQHAKIKARAAELSGGAAPSKSHLDQAASHVLSGGKSGKDSAAHMAARQGLIEGHDMAQRAGNAGIATAIRHSAKASGHDIDWGDVKDAPIPKVDEEREKAMQAFRDPRVETGDVPAAAKIPEAPARKPAPPPTPASAKDHDQENAEREKETARRIAERDQERAHDIAMFRAREALQDSHKAGLEAHRAKRAAAQAEGDEQGVKLHSAAIDAHAKALKAHTKDAAGAEAESAKAIEATNAANKHKPATMKPAVPKAPPAKPASPAPADYDFSGGAPDGGTPKTAKPDATQKPAHNAPPSKVEHNVTSSNVKRISWDPDKEGSAHGKMRVHFHNGSAYEHDNVHHNDYEKVRTSDSPGKAFNEHIRGLHDSRKLRDADTGEMKKETAANVSAARKETKEARAAETVRKYDEKSPEKTPPPSPKPPAEKRPPPADVVEPKPFKPNPSATPPAPKEEAPPKSADKRTLEDHVAEAKSTYGLSDKDMQPIQRKVDANERLKNHVKDGQHDQARAILRNHVATHLNQTRGDSPSQVERWMKLREKEKAITKALSEAEHRQRQIAAAARWHNHHGSASVAHAQHSMNARYDSKPDEDIAHRRAGEAHARAQREWADVRDFKTDEKRARAATERAHNLSANLGVRFHGPDDVQKAADTISKASVTDQLGSLLAATESLRQATQRAHWNVTGPTFHSLHEMFGEQYDELAAAVDEIAERMRARGVSQVQTNVDAMFSPPMSAEQFVDDLLQRNLACEALANIVASTADAQGDAGTVDLAGRRALAHGKAAWMLRATSGAGSALAKALRSLHGMLVKAKPLSPAEHQQRVNAAKARAHHPGSPEHHENLSHAKAHHAGDPKGLERLQNGITIRAGSAGLGGMEDDGQYRSPTGNIVNNLHHATNAWLRAAKGIVTKAKPLSPAEHQQRIDAAKHRHASPHEALTARLETTLKSSGVPYKNINVFGPPGRINVHVETIGRDTAEKWHRVLSQGLGKTHKISMVPTRFYDVENTQSSSNPSTHEGFRVYAMPGGPTMTKASGDLLTTLWKATHPDWHEIPEWMAKAYGCDDDVSKAAGHKYTRKVPTGKVSKTGRPIYRYFYGVSGGAGLGHHSEFKVGSAFRAKDSDKSGHFHITADHGDGHVTIKHDESGSEHKIHKDALAAMLKNQHAEALGAHAAKVAQDKADVAAHGSKAQKERLGVKADSDNRTWTDLHQRRWDTAPQIHRDRVLRLAREVKKTAAESGKPISDAEMQQRMRDALGHASLESLTEGQVKALLASNEYPANGQESARAKLMRSQHEASKPSRSPAPEPEPSKPSTRSPADTPAPAPSNKSVREMTDSELDAAYKHHNVTWHDAMNRRGPFSDDRARDKARSAASKQLDAISEERDRRSRLISKSLRALHRAIT